MMQSNFKGNAVFLVYVVVTLLTAAANLYAASNDFGRVAFVFVNMDKLGIPRAWLFTPGVLKTAGAIGLLIGLAIPAIGISAGAGLILFFLSAIAFTLRAHWYSHLPFPAPWLLLAFAALMLRVASR
jgi:hypothetical protein